MAHEIRPFSRTYAFASWLQSFGWRVLAASGDPALVADVAPLLVCIHRLPWGGPGSRGASVWWVWSVLVTAHAALFSRGIRV